MILLDYSAVAIASMMIAIKKDGEELTPDFALHMILNSVRKANKQHSRKYGTMVICCDNDRNWRRELFKEYKYKRKKNREKSDVDWDIIYDNLKYVKDELSDGFPYLVVEVEKAEADDIIGALARYATQNKKKSVIVSNDKDFIQLHSDYVSQYRPVDQSFVNHPNPILHLKELIIRGDADDGVPNIKTPDDHFTLEGKRQKSIFKKELDEWLYDDTLSFLTDETRANYERNKTMIDLSYTPKEIVEEAVSVYEEGRQRANKRKMTKFFMKHRLRYLHEKINDFM